MMNLKQVANHLIKIKTFLLFVIAFIFNTQITLAQTEVCSDKFDEISRSCISGYENKMKNLAFAISKQNAIDLENKTIFFITEQKSLGKMKINSSYYNGKECGITFEVITYNKKKIYKPSGSFTIKRDFESWEQDRAGFDPTSDNDFVLTHKNNKCVFQTNQALAISYKKTDQGAIFQGSDLIRYTSIILIGLVVFFMAHRIFKEEDKFKAQEKIEDADQDTLPVKVSGSDIVLKYSRPFFKRYFSPIVEGMKNKKKYREKYKRPLAAAGLTKILSPEDFFAFKLFLIIGAPLLFIGLRQFLEESWPMSLIPIVSIAGFFYPDIWIKGKIDQRGKEIVRAMPFIVDMLALSVEAGLDFMAAMQKVIEKAPPSALTDEFEILIKETKIGASRAEALRQMAWRVNQLPVSSFTATLIAADSVGASIGPLLKSLSNELRQKKTAEAEKAGATAATKILFPMLLLIMPAVFIIIMAPIILQFIGQ